MTASVDVLVDQFAPVGQHWPERFSRHGYMGFWRAVGSFIAGSVPYQSENRTIEQEFHSGDKLAWHSVRHTHPHIVRDGPFQHGFGGQSSEVNGRGFSPVNGVLPSAFSANSPLPCGASYRIRPSAGLVVPGFWFCVSGAFHGLISPFVRFLDRVGSADRNSTSGDDQGVAEIKQGRVERGQGDE